MSTSLSLKKYGWLLILLSSAGLVACKAKSSPRSNQNFVCQEGTESLNIQLEQSLEEFESILNSSRRGSRALTAAANEAVSLCQEYFSLNAGPSCVSRDSLNGQEITLGKEEYVDSCNRAAQHADESAKNQKPHRRDAQSLTEFESGELQIKVADPETLLKALQRSQPRLAFVNGELHSQEEAEDLARRGEVACAVKASRGKFIHGRFFSVVNIRDNSRRQGQSVSLTTADGLQISCQSNSEKALTPYSLKRAFGPVFEIRGKRAN